MNKSSTTVFILDDLHIKQTDLLHRVGLFTIQKKTNSVAIHMTKKILIVDDSKVSRMMLKSTLAKIDEFEVIEAADGQDGVIKYWEHRPDVTFMDLTMPVMDGFEAIKLIREGDSEAVIIVGTADIQAKSMQRVLDSGAMTVVKKPFQVDQVNSALTKAAGG